MNNAGDEFVGVILAVTITLALVGLTALMAVVATAIYIQW